MISNTFQIPIYQYKFEIDNQSLSKYCMDLSKKDKGRILSNVGGWQSKDFNENDKSMLIKKLWPYIKNHAIQYGKEIDLNVKGSLNNLWVNINEYKDSNFLHNHPGCLVSGVYYIKTHEDCGDIYFYHPSHKLLVHDWLKDVPIKYNSYNSISWWYPSIEGMLYLFPSWLEHCVKPNLNKRKKRISVSFNID